MADFWAAIPTILCNEGGYIDVPDDPGGETKYGISRRSYPNLDIANLTIEMAEAIYARDFWHFSGINSQAVATKLFDSYVNMGHSAIRMAQIVARVPFDLQDGVYGPHTEGLINAVDPNVFLIAFRGKLTDHYRNLVLANPALAKFLTGWLRRAAQ